MTVRLISNQVLPLLSATPIFFLRTRRLNYALTLMIKSLVVIYALPLHLPLLPSFLSSLLGKKTALVLIIVL